MKPAAFDLVQAADVASALEALGGDEAKPISGTQSIGPMLNLRLARPGLAVDVSRIPALREVKDEGDFILYGAAVTHAEIEDGAVPDATPGWLASAARRIAYRAVRNRGTLGGSLAHADPAADWVNVLTALDASVVLQSKRGERTMPVTGFFTGAFSTVLEPGEIITHVRVRKRGRHARWAYWKYCRKVGEFAMASAAVLIDPEHGEPRVLVGAIERPPTLLKKPEAVLAGRLGIAEAVAEAAPGLSAQSQALHVAAVGRAIALAHSTHNG
ncbi:FAD binding domain-containing protein [Terrihabitans sp. B22-R8]|uniref:FAD binding domain-containing protein n=1 Tax=Terrihabitans sp. B22-R8 TaxID=3425128 RepID=UPI00403CD3DD